MDPIHRADVQKRVVRRIERVDAGIVDAYRSFYTGIVLDHLGKLGAMETAITPIAPGMRVVGPAVTSLGADLTVRRMAIDLAQAGDVLIVAAGGAPDYACFGDGTARRMQVKGMVGAVIDGAIRDAAGLRALAFPTFARAITPRNYHYPSGIDFGAVNVPVVCGGVLVEPGDLIVGDDDGIVVVPRRIAGSLQETIARELHAERALRSSWVEYPSFGVESELQRRGYIFE